MVPVTGNTFSCTSDLELHLVVPMNATTFSGIPVTGTTFSGIPVTGTSGTSDWNYI